jgi:hypothetical protein
MIEFKRRLFISLLVLLAAAPKASPQTASSGPSAHQEIVRKTGQPGNSRSSSARNSIAKTSPGLCFQPGVGWQPIASGPAGGPSPHSVYPTSLSAKQAHSFECPGILTGKGELGAGIGTSAILNPNRSIRSAGSAKLGAVTSSGAPLHPNSAGVHSMTVAPSAVTSAPKHFASEAGPDEHADQLGARAFHAYISSIQLRKAIRNAPDFRTRMKLQQLQNDRATKLHNTRIDAKADKPTHGERVRATPLRRSDAKSRSRGNPRD